MAPHDAPATPYRELFDRAAGLDAGPAVPDVGRPGSAREALATMVRYPRCWRELLASLQSPDAWAGYADAEGLDEPEAIVLGLLLVGGAIAPAALPAAIGCWYRSAVLLEERGRGVARLAAHVRQVLWAATASAEGDVVAAAIAEAQVAFESVAGDLGREGGRIHREARDRHASLMIAACAQRPPGLAWDQALVLMASAFLVTGRPEALGQGMAASAEALRDAPDGAGDIPWAQWFGRARRLVSGMSASGIGQLGDIVLAGASSDEDRAGIARSVAEAMWLSTGINE